MEKILRIALLGGGPSSLLLFKRLVDSGRKDISITIFEKKNMLGAGMPYSPDGAGDEHITNVSGNEIPKLVTTVAEWLQTVDRDTLRRFHINPDQFSEYKVLPRLLFGHYLSEQFKLLIERAKQNSIDFNIRFNSKVIDITDLPEQQTVLVHTANEEQFTFDRVVICTGHLWPKQHEDKVPGYFDSPYPPAKLSFQAPHTVAIRGSSLTAIDAVRTLARNNGTFYRNKKDKLVYKPVTDGFNIIFYSRNGLLPAVRFHLEDPRLGKETLLSPQEIKANRDANGGFLALDFIFQRNFKDAFKEKEPEFYEHVKNLSLEDFVDEMMNLREKVHPFELLKAEYAEAEQSIKRRQSVYWKEMLGVLSFTMNYPAKYFSAEDMLRLQKTLMPLISIVIAYTPQNSVEELLALYQAGVLNIAAIGDNYVLTPKNTRGISIAYTDEQGQTVSADYDTFIDSIGQPHLTYEQLPYPTLLKKQTVSPARIKFKDAREGLAQMNQGNKKVNTDGKGNYYLQVPGVTINDHFQIVDEFGALNERIYMMAVPYIGGYNPDYSGLDFSEAASAAIAKSLLA